MPEISRSMLRIGYRLGERDLNWFCAYENLVTIVESCST
jgi:hypothetical protein